MRQGAIPRHGGVWACIKGMFAKFRYQILLCFLLLGILPNLLMSYYGYSQFYAMQMNSSLQATRELTRQVDRSMGLLAQRVNLAVLSLAVNRQLVNLLASDNISINALEQIEEFLLNFRIGNEYLYKDLAVIDAGGRVISDNPGIKIHDGQYFGALGRESEGAILWPGIRNIRDFRRHESGQRVLPVIKAINDPINGAYRGTLLVTIEERLFLEVINTVYEQSNAVLVLFDAQGNLLMASQELSAPEPLRQAVLSSGGLDFWISELQGEKTQFVRIRNRETGWQVLGYVSLASLLDRIDQMTLTVALFTWLALVLSVLFFSLIASRLTHKIEVLSRGMQELIDGNLQVQVAGVGSSEMAGLGRNFNAMVKRLREVNHENQRKNKELEQIIYVASHDLRSPLVNVDGFSRELEFTVGELQRLLGDGNATVQMDGLLKTLTEELPDMLKSLGRIRSSARQMDHLLKGLLKLSRWGRAALQIGPLDMNNLLKQVIISFAYRIKEQKINLVLADLPPCIGDVIQVSQIFANLIDNAIKYCDPQRFGEIRINGAVEGAWAVYTVIDNGIGIAQNHQHNIFELFHRLNPRSTEGEGLGLTLVRQMLDRLGGEIEVRSTSGEGSSFIVRLPLAPMEPGV
jgi:signal transduction histidine kinase